MSELSFSRVDSPGGRPYNPPTADEAAPKSANETSETFENSKKFEMTKTGLTGHTGPTKPQPPQTKRRPSSGAAEIGGNL
jgi:hypothetical protein